MIATGTPFTMRSAYGLNTGASKSAVFTFCAPIMSAPLVQSDVAEPCQVSPPSSSSACGREARRRFTSVARCAKPPTLPRRRFEIEVGEGVRGGAARRDPEALEQRLADQVRRPTCGLADPEVDARLPKMDRPEEGVRGGGGQE